MGKRPPLAILATFSFVMGFSSAVSARDAAAYRGFRLGMTVAAVEAQAGIPPGGAKVVFQSPLLIQELEWRPSDAGTSLAVGTQDAVGQVLFDFCNGELYRIVVSYSPDRTEGLTGQDLVEALSAEYGPATTPRARIITSPAAQTYTDSETVTARWEDQGASVNLFQGGYRSAFGLVIYSKSLAPIARAGIDQGRRVYDLDAPRRELAEQKARDDIERAAHAKARGANKAAFRY